MHFFSPQFSLKGMNDFLNFFFFIVISLLPLWKESSGFGVSFIFFIKYKSMIYNQVSYAKDSKNLVKGHQVLTKL